MADHDTHDHTGIPGVGGTPAAVAACAYNNTTQSIATGIGTPTVVTFNAEDFDTSTFHDTGSSTGRLTIPTTGKYLVHGRIYAPFTAVSAKYLGLLLNGNTTPIRRVDGPLDASDATMQVTAMLSLTAGDYVELGVEHNNAGSQNIGHASARRVQNEFSITFLGA